MDEHESIPRIVFAHGFTQTGRSWELIASQLATHLGSIEAVMPDLSGHGDAAESRDDLWHSGEALAGVGGTATYVGYSMGGRVALHTALSFPERVERLVLIGATAGIVDDGERAARRSSDDALADRIERLGIEAFIDEWLQNPLFAGLNDNTSLRSDRLRNTSAGLASSLRLAGSGTQEPLWGRLGDICCPVLVLVGERDAKFTELGERLIAGLPAARLVAIPDAGHSVHLEQPAATAAAIADFVR